MIVTGKHVKSWASGGDYERPKTLREMLSALAQLGYKRGVIGKGTYAQLYRGRRVVFDYEMAFRVLGGDIYAMGVFC